MKADAEGVPGEQLDEELLTFYSRQAWHIGVPVAIAALLLASLSLRYLPPEACFGWLLLVIFMQVMRCVALQRLQKLTARPPRLRLRLVMVLSLLNGGTHAASLAFFPYLPELERVVQTVLLLGLSTGSIATSAGYRPVFLAYSLPVMGGLALCWLLLPHGGRLDGTSAAVALIIAVLAGLLTTIAGDSFRLFRDSFQIRWQQAKLNERLSQALAQAEEANQAKTRFLAAASHDLRQPIHTLSLFSAALGMRTLDGATRQIVDHIDSALQTLSAQLDALLDISKLDAGVVQTHPVQLDVAAFLQRLQADHRELAAARGIRLQCETSGNAGVRTDPVLFGRVVRNLLDNALKYTQRGSVKLTLANAPGLAVVIIQDTGPGIPDGEQQRVFEEFYQLQHIPERCGGLGLGLSIVTRLVALLRLRLEMVSRAGVGTTCYLMLPLSDAAGPSPLQPAALDGTLSGLHALVIDNDANVRAAMQLVLVELGARVSVAAGTEEALHCARHDRPDLALVDYRLDPGDSGLVSIQALRELYPALPAILVTGDTAPDRLREAQHAGIPLLHKPVQVHVLLQAVGRLQAATEGVDEHGR